MERTVVYKTHTIVNYGRLSDGGFSWRTRDGTEITYFLTVQKRCSTEDDASTVALAEAKVWIDNRP